MSHIRLAALALTATTLAVSGCGESSKTASTGTSAAATIATTTAVTTPATTTTPVPAVTVKVASGKPLTRAQWIAKGDAICAHFNAEAETIGVTGVAELPRVLPEEAAFERNTVAQLAKLTPPGPMANDWQRFLNDTLQLAEDADKLAQSGVPDEDLLKSPLARTIQETRRHATRIAKHDGFKACASA